MDPPRFYVPGLLAQTQQVAGNATARLFVDLPEAESHHAHAVLRLGTIDAVLLFDGHGAWTTGIVAGIDTLPNRKKIVHIMRKSDIHVDPPPAISLTLATAVPKGERADWLVEQASQLNASAVQWLDCDRSVVKPREGGAKLGKWQRLAIEAAKQCHRTHLLHIAELAPVEKVVPAAIARGEKILWLEPRQDDSSGTISEILTGFVKGKLLALIGPEGGWSRASSPSSKRPPTAET